MSEGATKVLAMNTYAWLDDEDLPADAPYLLDNREDDIPLTAVNIIGATADPLKDYLRQISKRAPIQPGEDFELAKQVELGVIAEAQLFSERAKQDNDYLSDLRHLVRAGQQARTRLIESNMILVVKTAKRRAGRGVALLDLIQEGNIGLIRALEKYDYRKGASFASFAWFSVEQSIARAVMDHAHTIRVPVHMGEQIERMQRVSSELHVELERQATVEEISDRMGLAPRKILEMRAYAKDPLSLSTPVSEDGQTLSETLNISDSGSIERHASAWLLREALDRTLAHLTEREERIMRLRYGLDDGEPKTLEEIGYELDLTRERIRQIEAGVFEKLTDSNVLFSLADFLEAA